MKILVSGGAGYIGSHTVIQLIAAGKVDLDILVTGRFALADSEEALKAGKQAGQLKAVVYPGR